MAEPGRARARDLNFSDFCRIRTPVAPRQRGERVCSPVRAQDRRRPIEEAPTFGSAAPPTRSNAEPARTLRPENFGECFALFRTFGCRHQRCRRQSTKNGTCNRNAATFREPSLTPADATEPHLQ